MIELIYDILIFKPENKKELKKIKKIRGFLLGFIILFLFPTVFLILANIFSFGIVPFVQGKFLVFHYGFGSILKVFLSSLPFLIPLILFWIGFAKRYRDDREKF